MERSKNYRELIAMTAKSHETVRGFALRMANNSNVITASMKIALWPFGSKDQPSAPTTPNYNSNKKVFIIFSFDKKNDIMHVSQDGREILTFKGEEAWGKAIDHFKRLFMRKQLNPQMTHFLYRGNKGLIDISSDFALSSGKSF